MRLALLLLFLSCAGTANAEQPRFFEDWERTDTVLLGSALALSAIDWGQTKYATRETVTTTEIRRFHTDGTETVETSTTTSRQYREENPFLGRHPSRGDVDRYFAIAALGTVALSAVLPTRYRRYFLTGVIVVESLVVLRNHHLGIRVAF